MRCSKCQADNREGRKFCASCGSPLAIACSKCGGSNLAGEQFCGECGAALEVKKGTIKSPSIDPHIRITSSTDEPVDGERKTVTSLFADIKGSTELMEDLDPEEARTIVDPALKLMMEAVQRYDGYVVQSTGDGISALFGAPLAHEDHPQRALYAALRMHDEIRRYADRLRAEGRAPLQIRVGANTGEVVVRTLTTGVARTEYNTIGHTTNLAARMQALANPGSTVIAESTRRLVEGYFALKALGASHVKGITEPVNIYEVSGLGPLRTRLQRAAGRGLTKFVGREREMTALKHALAQVKTGHGQIVAAMAEPGIGKSRLYFEFKAVEQSGCMLLETFSVSHGKASAYLPVIDLLHGYFDIKSEDDGRKRREKVAGRIAILDRALEDVLPYLFALLGIVEGDDPLAQMDGQVKKRRTLDAIKRILLRESLNQPLIVIFEDLHWIDEQTQEFLNLLADSIGTARILLLVNYRPEYSHQWGSKTYYTQLRLDPLGRESAEAMLLALLGDSTELIPLKRLIIEKTEGTPFFMEETVQVLTDEGTLVRNGVVKLMRPLSDLKIPPTVQAILAARIDRLVPEAKDLLQTLAVIGREFPLSMIQSITSKPHDELDRLLNDLQLGEFIYEQPAMGDAEYVFKHALTQEVAYNSVLIERRKQLHERIGAALERLYANSLDDHLNTLAHHYGSSGNAVKALEYHERAGLQAIRRSSYSDAARNLNAALELVLRLPDTSDRDRREFGLQTSLGQVLMLTNGWSAPETVRAYLRAEELATTGGALEEHFALLVGLFGVPFVGGQLSVARERLKKNWEFVDRHPEPTFIFETLHHEWSAAFVAGELESAQHQIERGLAVYNAQLRSVRLPLYSAHHPAICGYAWGGNALMLRGRVQAARHYATQALALGRELGDPVSLSWALSFEAGFHCIAREVLPTLDMAEAAIEKAEEIGIPYVVGSSRVLKGWALANLGRASEGVELIRSAISALAAMKLYMTLSWAMLAEAYKMAQRIEEGLLAIDEALRLVEFRGERFWEAEIHRLHGELLQLQNEPNLVEAQKRMEEAVEIARRQDAKLLELRATASLARLLRDTDRRDEARTILTGIYNWFTEGYDTPDLKDARALLDELRA
jgi:class 3 adenylate cyclase/tetratricopeptide (TPR) repeat protein